jgi:hypothetical protein
VRPDGSRGHVPRVATSNDVHVAANRGHRNVIENIYVVPVVAIVNAVRVAFTASLPLRPIDSD